MSTEQVIIAVISLVFGGGGVAALGSGWFNYRLGIKKNETDAKNQVNVGWESIVRSLTAQLAEQRATTDGIQTLYKDAIERIDQMEKKMEDAAITRRRMADHIDLLEDDIRREYNGVPRPRPANL